MFIIHVSAMGQKGKFEIEKDREKMIILNRHPFAPRKCSVFGWQNSNYHQIIINVENMFYNLFTKHCDPQVFDVRKVNVVMKNL